MICGRRSGKSRCASVIAAHVAALADVSKLVPGETGVVLICAASKRQAAVVYNYVRALFADVPSLRPLVAGEAASEDVKILDLRHRTRIEVRSASFRLVRGMTLLCAIIDEVAFLRDESSAIPDVELVRALKPALLTTNGLLLGLSSPWAQPNASHTPALRRLRVALTSWSAARSGIESWGMPSERALWRTH